MNNDHKLMFYGYHFCDYHHYTYHNKNQLPVATMVVTIIIISHLNLN